MATQRVKTEIRWEPSPDQVDGYGVKVIINGKQVGFHELPADARGFTVDSEKRGNDPKDRDHVVVFVAPVKLVEGRQIWGQAQAIEFLTDDTTPPRPCGKPTIDKVVPGLPILGAEAPAAKPEYGVMVTGHARLVDGAVGTVKAFDAKGVNAEFQVDMLRTPEAADVKAVGIDFPAENPGGEVTIINPDQSTQTLAEFCQAATPGLKLAV